MDKKDSLPPLPPSSDPYWEEATTHSIDMSKQQGVVCSKDSHDYIVDWSRREVQCEKCGLGFHFKMSQIEDVLKLTSYSQKDNNEIITK